MAGANTPIVAGVNNMMQYNIDTIYKQYIIIIRIMNLFVNDGKIIFNITTQYNIFSRIIVIVRNLQLSYVIYKALTIYFDANHLTLTLYIYNVYFYKQVVACLKRIPLLSQYSTSLADEARDNHAQQIERAEIANLVRSRMESLNLTGIDYDDVSEKRNSLSYVIINPSCDLNLQEGDIM